MLKKTALGLTFLLCLSVSAARAEWTRLPASPDDADIRFIAPHPREASVLYAASERRVYRTTDGGAAWKPVLSVRGESRVRALYASAGTVYVGGEKGLKRSSDGGKRWDMPYQRSGRAGTVRAIAPAAPGSLWLGTDDGLVRLDEATGVASEVPSLPKSPVHSVVVSGDGLFIATPSGVFGSDDAGQSWRQVFFSSLEERPDTALEQFSVEEIPAVLPSGLACLSGSGAWFAATPDGIVEGRDGAESWNRLDAATVSGRDVRAIAASRNALYAATGKGVYRWDPKTRTASGVSEGLASVDTRALVYDASGDTLLAATGSGLYKLSHPELHFAPAPEAPRPDASQLLARFAAEPSVRYVQAAAIRYAEVHPDKIRAWRAAAARKAWLPTVSFDSDFGANQNVDIDRGGTADPDRFIFGPEEKSTDWSVGLSWNLGELIWNDDQTSIDTRSKLMAELRDEILSEVTHLYYERRRLQAEAALAPPRELPVQIEKILKMEELTARLDALTGGFLSERSSITPEVR